MYTLLNVVFIVFHTALILFNLLGWIWKRTRRLNLISLLLTGGSWAVLGIWYGFGYCPLTDWHWQVRRRLGYTDMPQSYISFLIEQWTGLHVSAPVVNALTLVCFLAALGVSVYLNSRDYSAGGA